MTTTTPALDALAPFNPGLRHIPALSPEFAAAGQAAMAELRILHPDAARRTEARADQLQHGGREDGYYATNAAYNELQDLLPIVTADTLSIYIGLRAQERYLAHATGQPVPAY